MATIPGSPGDDTLLGTGAADLILGFGGDDLLNGLAADDTLRGNRGNDRLFGGSGNDILLGGLDDDTLDGGTGDDLLSGSSGNDALIGQDGNDTLIGSTGNDFLDGGDDDDTLNGGWGRDTLLGGAGNDELDGDTQDDFVDGGAGNDLVLGWTGDDTLLGGSGNDTLQGSSGDDSLHGGDGHDRLNGGSGNDILDGGEGNDLLDGRSGDDSLLGGLGDDTLFGKDGNDTLDGGAGNDTLNGGSGNDTLILADDLGDSIQGGSGQDTLLLQTPGLVLDLPTIPDEQITGIEIIDLGVAGNTLILDRDEVLNLSDSSNRLVVLGDAGDRVLASGDWTFQGTRTFHGTQVETYRSGAAQLWIDQDVTVDLSFSRTVLNLSEIDGSNGYVITGDQFGALSLAGDLNGDGIPDLVGRVPSPPGSAGGAVVVFGNPSVVGSQLEIPVLDGANGFVALGLDAGDGAGSSVSGFGDINGDGIADLVIGAPTADGGPGNPMTRAGESYVIFGRGSGFDPVVSLSDLDGSNGLLLRGIDARDYSGRAVSAAGDINGDGFTDILIGAPYADRGSDYYGFYAGEAYIVFGREAGFDPMVDLSALDGSNGFLLAGASFYDYAGQVVATGGDINGDGFDDIVVAGRPEGTIGDLSVVFGQASGFAPTVDLAALDGGNGFHITIPGDGYFGFSLSIGSDLNGDGFSDLILGVPEGGEELYGATFVIFGRSSGFPPEVDLGALDGSNGFVIEGGDEDDFLGDSAFGAGDVNGDGFDDMIITAAFGGGGPGNPQFGAGESYLIFGRADGFGSAVNLNALSASEGLLITGSAAQSGSRATGAAPGDINGDGFDDVLIGENGKTYVIYGSDFTGAVDQQGTDANDTLTGDANANVLIGGRGNDTLIGNGGPDVLYGAQGDDVLAISDAALQRLNGGAGFDTLRLDGPGFALDLTLIADLKIEEVEAIDLQEGAGAHSLTLNVLEVLNLSDTSNTLRVLGDGADTVDIGAGWTAQAPVGDFAVFTQGAATLEIGADIAVVA